MRLAAVLAALLAAAVCATAVAYHHEPQTIPGAGIAAVAEIQGVAWGLTPGERVRVEYRAYAQDAYDDPALYYSRFDQRDWITVPPTGRVTFRMGIDDLSDWYTYHVHEVVAVLHDGAGRTVETFPVNFSGAESYR